ncbi:hypothetical protein SAM23877_4225 [Streptomyces ambofaciens ATCC 23877]|uniref:Uncharacterized protein n=1 Tax=Streptomyces ambofaciens (strain ATCC 23877 / 3486 / DSM 40053 / JCM 4204 / NBRC 12836 / NRRL B-2516) TaxID=278992 RepID=A0A0K2AVV4_STRA7|nr:hypothetical protein SAM23877_4225 [Streptomyces ambofaciens ATCC 23877]
MYSPERLSQAFLRALPFGLAFPTLSDLSDPISSVLSRFSLSRFPFRRFRLYQILSGSDSPSEGGVSTAVGPFQRGETLADSRLPS